MVVVFPEPCRPTNMITFGRPAVERRRRRRGR
jgi:hypothetical protein